MVEPRQALSRATIGAMQFQSAYNVKMVFLIYDLFNYVGLTFNVECHGRGPPELQAQCVLARWRWAGFAKKPLSFRFSM